MKRSLYIVCLVLLSIAARGTDYVPTTHYFQNMVPSQLLFTNNSHTGTVPSDGTVYDCANGAVFESYNSQVCIKIPRNDEVIISPAKERLSHFVVHHNAIGSELSQVQISISTDGENWTVVPDEQLIKYTNSIEATSLNGDYYIKLKNKYSTNAKIVYINEIVYYTSSCHCLRVVSE